MLKSATPTQEVRTNHLGFSLVEMMVAMALSLLVVGSLIALFVGFHSASGTTAGISSLTDNGRFALNYIEQTTRSAGFLACSTSSASQNILTGSSGAQEIYYNFSQAMEGYEALNTGPGGVVTLLESPTQAQSVVGNWTPPLNVHLKLDLTPSGTDPGGVISGSDILVVRESAQNAQQPTTYVTSIVDGSTSFVVNNVGQPGELLTLQPNQLAAISNCGKNYVFQITGVAGTAPATISHASGSGSLNSSSTFAANTGSFTAGSQVSPVNTIVYYIGVGADGDGALFRADLLSNPGGPTSFYPVELVPDIENMQILYGVDTTAGSTTSVNQYLTADQVTDFNTVMSVKVALLSASPIVASKNTGPGALTNVPSTAQTFSLLGTAVTAPLDTRLRRVFEVNIAVRNAVK